jgi:hypothetical protein
MKLLKQSFMLACLVCGICSGQTTGPSAPSTAPTMAPIKITLPSSLIRVEVGDHVAVCEANDEKWVRAALTAAKPATRPSTMPADILARVQSTRDETSKEIEADALIAPKDVDEFYDKILIPSEQREANVKTHLILLVTTKARLIELMRAGFTLPNFHFNPLSNEISFSPNLVLTEDEQVIHSLYAPETPESARREALSARVRDMDSMRMTAQGSESAILAQRMFVGFVGSKLFVPMKLRPDQEWFGLGVLGWLGAKYTAPIIEIDRSEMVRQLSAQPRSPVRMASLDLVHPSDPAQLRPEYVPAYVDAMRRRSLAVVASWVKRDGDSVIPRTLAELKKGLPADGPGLVKLVKDATGTDLSPDLGPQP